MYRTTAPRLVTFVTLLAVSVSLSACLSINKAPDETRVVAGPNLSIPPEFYLTPPQQDGVATPAERAANDDIEAAQSALFGEIASEEAPLSQDATSVDFLIETSAE